MEIRVLGPFEVVAGGEPVALGGARQRSVLALLVLHAGEVVSADRIVEALWGDHAPADAQAALQAHVSRLRRALAPHELILTRPGGYLVETPATDATRFGELAERARGEPPEAAAETLREALAQFRGRPLADLEGEPWAAGPARELEEARLEALERRLDADLALDRDLIPELAGHVREHPLRERLRAQHMLALYRAGRQADALEAFAAARRELVEELGIEPGPELRRLHQQILEQDPELDRRRALPSRPPRRGRRALALAALLATAAVPAALLAGGDDPARATRADGQLAVLDARSGKLVRRIGAGTTPQAIAAAGDSAWVIDGDEQLVRRVTLESGEVSSFTTGTTPADVAAAGEEVWLVEAQPSSRRQIAGPVPGAVVRVDPVARTVRARVELPPAGGTRSPTADHHVAVTRGAIWAVGAGGRVVRIDPRSHAVVATVRGFEALAVAAGEGGVWLLGESGRVARVDETTNRVAARGRISASVVSAMTVGGGSAWVTASADGTLWRLDARGRGRSLEVGQGAGDVAFAAGAAWVANPLRGTVTRVDAGTERAGAPIDVGGLPRGIAAAGDRVVVAIDGASARLPAAVSRAGGVAAPGCGPVVGAPVPQRIVVADLPLQGGIRVSAQQVALAVEHVMRSRRFRAGALTLGLQVCDHSIARTGLFDEARCASLARAYGRTPKVIGVIGPINTPCAAASLPESNRAGLAVVSPLATAPLLTRDRALRPSGERNFARTAPPDDREAAALAKLARDLGARRVAVASDGLEYGAALARDFERAARRLGLPVTRVRGWRRARFAGADAVFLGGLLDTGGAAVLRRVPDGVPTLVPSGFTPTPLLAERAGPAVADTYLAVNGLLADSLPATGRRFVREFGRSLPGAEVEPSAAYAAAAAEALLDAIARSDGSRRSVRTGLLGGRAETVLGTMRFDARGDPRDAAATILRMAPGRNVDVFEDAELVRVIRTG